MINFEPKDTVYPSLWYPFVSVFSQGNILNLGETQTSIFYCWRQLLTLCWPPSTAPGVFPRSLFQNWTARLFGVTALATHVYTVEILATAFLVSDEIPSPSAHALEYWWDGRWTKPRMALKDATCQDGQWLLQETLLLLSDSSHLQPSKEAQWH